MEVSSMNIDQKKEEDTAFATAAVAVDNQGREINIDNSNNSNCYSYKLIVQYDGTRYNGFQRQTVSTLEKTKKNKERLPKRPRYNEHGCRIKGICYTIQDAIEDAFRLYVPYEISTAELRLRVAGRTDKGVHARGQVIAIDLPKPLKDPEWKIRQSLNSRLPIDVSISSCRTCHTSFQPRFNVLRKQYSYRMRYRNLVLDEKTGKPLPICLGGPYAIQTAFDTPDLWKCPWALDTEKLKRTCKFLCGRHDFTSFVHKDNRYKRDKRCSRRQGQDNNDDDDNKVCNVVTLEKFDIVILHQSGTTTAAADDGEEEEIIAPWIEIKFLMEAKGFRRSMCRNLVGFVTEVARNEILEEKISDCWTDPSMVCSAPACGLCLEYIVYEK